MTRAVRVCVAAVMTAALLWLNIATLSESFGPGPPYYGRTTNLDKWHNPLPWLVTVDLLVLTIASALVVPCLRQKARACRRSVRN